MIRPAILIFASAISLSACAAGAAASPPTAAFLAARLLSAESADPKRASLLADRSGSRPQGSARLTASRKSSSRQQGHYRLCRNLFQALGDPPRIMALDHCH